MFVVVISDCAEAEQVFLGSPGHLEKSEEVKRLQQHL